MGKKGVKTEEALMKEDDWVRGGGAIRAKFGFRARGSSRCRREACSGVSGKLLLRSSILHEVNNSAIFYSISDLHQTTIPPFLLLPLT
jgi:hypothetical protein